MNLAKLLRNIYFRVVQLSGVLNLKPVVFLHLQKTAGTSIIEVARQVYRNENVMSHGDFCRDSYGDLDLNKCAEPEYLLNKLNHLPFISGHFGYAIAKVFMEDRYSFTFLRNPVERVLSFYYFCKTRNPKQFETYALAQTLSLDEFLSLGFTDPGIKGHIWNYQVCQLADGWGGINDLPKSDEELLATAERHLNNFSYIGFTETFDKDRLRVLKDIGITVPTGNFRFNTNPGHPVFDDLPQSSKKLLLELTELDRKLYDQAWAKKNSVHSANPTDA